MAEDAMLLAVKSAVSSVMTELSPDVLNEQASLRELGANSLDRAEILMRVMEDLKKHFDKLGASLTAGQDLKIDVLDIDLAG